MMCFAIDLRLSTINSLHHRLQALACLSSLAARSHRFWYARNDDEVESSTVCEAHCREVAHVAGGQARHIQFFRKCHDRGIHQPQFKVGVGRVDCHGTAELCVGRWRVDERSTTNVGNEGAHGCALVPEEVVQLGQDEPRNIPRTSSINCATEGVVIGRGGDQVVDQGTGIADQRGLRHRSMCRKSSDSSPRSRKGRLIMAAERGFGCGRNCSRARHSCRRTNSDRDSPTWRAPISTSLLVSASRVTVVGCLRRGSAMARLYPRSECGCNAADGCG
jgi:hypothetical protein